MLKSSLRQKGGLARAPYPVQPAIAPPFRGYDRRRGGHLRVDSRAIANQPVAAGNVAPEDAGALLALHRSMVRLRTYDERSVVYHRQGRIGTYAIFWGHEGMQAGSFHALDRGDWIFPSYRESAIGLLRGMPPETVLAWWRGHPAGWWGPREDGVASLAGAIPQAGGILGSTAWPPSRCQSRPTCRTQSASPGGRSSAASLPARSRTSATGPPRKVPSTRARTSPP